MSSSETNVASVARNLTIDRLPNELLTTVFELSVSTDTSVLDISKPPWTTSHVCRRWRNLSLGVGALWCNITIDISECSASPFSGQMRTLETFLARSRNQGLFVRIEGSEEISEFAFWRILQKSCHIQDLEVELCIENFNLFRYLDNPFPFPSLQNLVVKNSSSPVHGSPHGVFRDFLTVAPQLRKVVFGEGFGWDGHLIVARCLPAAQLVDIEIHDDMDPTESCLSILKSCPQLRSLCLPGATSECEKSMFPDPVRHDNLTSLTIRCDWTVPGEDEDEDDTSSIFDFIALPSLSSLIFKSDWRMNLLSFVGALGPPVIQSFIARSSCTIRHLRIDSTVALSDHFCDFLAVVPLLEVLEYRPSDPMSLPTPFIQSLDDYFMHELYYDPDEENSTRVLLPKLKTLIMEDCHGFGKDSFFPFMVESRYGLREGSEVANLEKVSFMVEDDLGPDGMGILTSLMLRGLGVRVKKRIWEDEGEGIKAVNPEKSKIHSIVQVLPGLG